MEPASRQVPQSGARQSDLHAAYYTLCYGLPAMAAVLTGLLTPERRSLS